jgi:hypothetical protein
MSDTKKYPYFWTFAKSNAIALMAVPKQLGFDETIS